MKILMGWYIELLSFGGGKNLWSEAGRGDWKFYATPQILAGIKFSKTLIQQAIMWSELEMKMLDLYSEYCVIHDSNVVNKDSSRVFSTLSNIYGWGVLQLNWTHVQEGHVWEGPKYASAYCLTFNFKMCCGFRLPWWLSCVEGSNKAFS